MSAVGAVLVRADRDRDDALRLDPLKTKVVAPMENYGAAKVARESAVRAGFGSSRAVITPAVLIGCPTI